MQRSRAIRKRTRRNFQWFRCCCSSIDSRRFPVLHCWLGHVGARNSQHCAIRIQMGCEQSLPLFRRPAVTMLALYANTIATAVMVGVIWFVQVVHYPLLAQFGSTQSVAVAEQHQQRTGYVVGLPMLVEGLSTLWLLARTPDGVAALLPWVNAVLLAVALGSTLFLSVPLHAKMALAHNDETGRKLVVTNWPRTIAWTVRLTLCGVMLAQVA